VGLAESLDRLRGGLSRPQHDFIPSLATFAPLNVDSLTDRLKITQRGKERGEKSQPPVGDTNIDIVETEIVNLIEREKSKSLEIYHNNIEDYRSRLANLDLEQSVSVIETETLNAQSDFHTLVISGQNVVHSARRDVVASEQEISDFRQKHRINRNPHLPNPGITHIRIGVLAIIFLLETISNSSFLAKSNVLGLWGAYTEAMVISFLNIFAGVIAALFGWRWLAHRSFGRKLIGFFICIFHLAASIAFNDVVAHYRQVSGTIIDNGGFAAIQSFSMNPWGLDDFQSWLLFAMGLSFSYITVIDVYGWDDSYPGYGNLGRRLRKSRGNYIAQIEFILEMLTDRKDEAVKALEESRQELSNRRGECESIHGGFRLLCTRFGDYQDQLERLGIELLERYRDANREARKGNAPKRFKEKWVLQRTPIEWHALDNLSAPTEVSALVERGSDILRQSTKDLLAEYESAADSFLKLDDIVRGASQYADIKESGSHGPETQKSPST
jgi:hypothetical protein